MTKILTAHILFQEIESHSLSLEEKIPISVHASRQEGSRMFLIPDQNVSVDDILKGIIVSSANDACTAISEYIMGNESEFAHTMNRVAKELGATNSNFINASGLPDSNHYSTCWDLARISQKTIQMFPQYYKKYYGIPFFSFNGIHQGNRNTLLRNGADGIKTGQTEIGKFGIVASEERNGRRLILVINGCKNAQERAREARRLLDIGFKRFHSLVLEEGQFIADIPIWKRSPVRALVGKRVALSLSRHQASQVRIKACYKKPLRHPIKKGQTIGSLLISLPEGKSLSVPLIAESATAPGGIKRLWKYLWGNK